MKKILLTISAFALTFSFNAQTIVNGDLEAPMVPNQNFPGTYTIPGYFSWLTSPETANPAEALQSAKLETKQDAALNAALQWGDPNDILPAYFTQTVKETILNPATLELSFMYKYTNVANDSAYIQVAVYDTLLAGAADDVMLYFDYLDLRSTVSSYTNNVFQMNATGNIGVANRMVFYAISSQTGYFQNASGTYDTPPLGTIVWLDNFIVSNTAKVSENNKLEAVVYPNPTANFLNFNVNQVVSKIEVTSMDGKLLISKDFNSTIGSVNVSDLNSGMYNYTITTRNGEKSASSFVKN